MTVELLQIISMIGFIFCAILLLLTVVLFFVLKIPQLISNLSGATARKAIKEIREQNEKGRGYQPSEVNQGRGRVTDKISLSGRLMHETGTMGYTTVTDKIGTRSLMPTKEEISKYPMNQTTLLQGDETAILECNQTTLLQNNETTILQNNETTMLDQTTLQMSMSADKKMSEEIVFSSEVVSRLIVDIEIGFWESEEVIE